MNEASTPTGLPLLEFRDVHYSFGKMWCIESVSFALAAGELVGLMGPNGAGKTTLLKLAAGLLTPRCGVILAENREVRSWPGNERAQRLAYLPQLLDMQAPFRVGELVGMGAYSRGGGQRFSSAEALDIVGLADRSSAFLADLSGGERRRAYIAMTLVQGGRLLLLDEPLANLDLKYQVELIRLVRRICATGGMSVLLSLHDIVLGEHLDRVLMMKDGRLVAQGAPAEVLTMDTVRTVYDLDMSGNLWTLPADLSR